MGKNVHKLGIQRLVSREQFVKTVNYKKNKTVKTGTFKTRWTTINPFLSKTSPLGE